MSNWLGEQVYALWLILCRLKEHLCSYHGSFSNGAKAVDEYVARNINWRTCMETQSQWTNTRPKHKSRLSLILGLEGRSSNKSREEQTRLLRFILRITLKLIDAIGAKKWVKKEIYLIKSVKVKNTFKVRPYPGIISRCSPHQFVQEVRWRHGYLPWPRIVHFLTLTHIVEGTEHGTRNTALVANFILALACLQRLWLKIWSSI